MEFEAGITMPDLSGFTLLLPSVSVGNVGQLAIDVVLATLKPSLVSQVKVSFRDFNKSILHSPDLASLLDPLQWG